MDEFKIDENLTHEQKVRLSLFDIKNEIRIGWIFICAFILMLIMVLVSPSTTRLLYLMVSAAGLLVIWIMVTGWEKQVKRINEKAIDYFHYKNKRRRKK